MSALTPWSTFYLHRASDEFQALTYPLQAIAALTPGSQRGELRDVKSYSIIREA